MQLIKSVRAENLYFYIRKLLAIKYATQPFPLNIVDSTYGFLMHKKLLNTLSIWVFSVSRNEAWMIW